jgi:hypothetical protein
MDRCRIDRARSALERLCCGSAVDVTTTMLQ